MLIYYYKAELEDGTVGIGTSTGGEPVYYVIFLYILLEWLNSSHFIYPIL